MRKDILKEIFKKQTELNKKIEGHKNYYKIYQPLLSESNAQELVNNKTNIVMAKILKYCQALNVELSELTDATCYKMWKNVIPKWGHIREELIDCLHFFVSIYTVAPPRFYKTYESLFDNIKFFPEIERDYKIRGIQTNIIYMQYYITSIMCQIMDYFECNDTDNINLITKYLTEDAVEASRCISNMLSLLFKDWNDIKKTYESKMKINHKRQKDGY